MDRGIYFDEDYRVRLLDVEKHYTSKSLLDNCSSFLSNMQQVKESLGKYLAGIDQQVERVEAEKLRAVGLRNRVAALNEERRRKQQELQQLLKEKQEELDRLLAEELSLTKVVQEQDALIAKLSDDRGTAL